LSKPESFYGQGGFSSGHLSDRFLDSFGHNETVKERLGGNSGTGIGKAGFGMEWNTRERLLVSGLVHCNSRLCLYNFK